MMSSSAECGKRHTAADDFAHRGQVGRDAVQRLRAAERDAEAGHHFVVNQHGAVFFGQFAQVYRFGRADQVHIADEGFATTQAISSPLRANASSSWAVLLYSRTKVCLVKSAGTPAEDGPPVSRPLPALTSRLSEWPW